VQYCGKEEKRKCHESFEIMLINLINSFQQSLNEAATKLVFKDGFMKYTAVEQTLIIHY